MNDNCQTYSIRYGNRLMMLDRPRIMGILNLTPDSFYDGGQHTNVQTALGHTKGMMDQGADIIDIGACSTRPGARLPDSQTEWQRLAPVLKAIRRQWPKALVSVDTFRAEVAIRAVEEHGANMVNDISAGIMDADMIKTVAGLRVPYAMMHMQGRPENMQDKPQYRDVVADVLQFFAHRADAARQAGISDLIIDPGFGFGKSAEHNYTLLNKLDDLMICGLPILVGLSRKSMIWRTLGTGPGEALNGTTALHMAALMRGADILRVHDVKEADQVRALYCNLNRKNTGQKK